MLTKLKVSVGALAHVDGLLLARRQQFEELPTEPEPKRLKDDLTDFAKPKTGKNNCYSCKDPDRHKLLLWSVERVDTAPTCYFR